MQISYLKSLIPNIYKLRPNRGFALLISIIVSSIIITLAISIVNSAIREVVLASTVRSSALSFYMADSGMECTLYWDNVRGNFDKDSAFFSERGGGLIECMGQVVSIVPSPKVEFSLKGINDDMPCVDILVTATPVTSDESKRLIDSHGYNTCDLKSNRRVDRALEVKYSVFQ